MNVLVVCAHPDDETLGCGGSLLSHAARGDCVSWLISTRVHAPRWTQEQADAKQGEIEAVVRAYGIARYRQLSLPSAKMTLEHLPELIEEVSRVIRDWSPEVVYTVHGGDIHTDHCLTSQAVMAAVKPFMMPGLGVRRVLAFETLSSTDAAPPDPGRAFVPQSYRDITPWIDRKLDILSLYASENHCGPLPRTREAALALARYRGACAGVEYAEAFMIMREHISCNP